MIVQFQKISKFNPRKANRNSKRSGEGVLKAKIFNRKYKAEQEF